MHVRAFEKVSRRCVEVPDLETGSPSTSRPVVPSDRAVMIMSIVVCDPDAPAFQFTSSRGSDKHGCSL